MVYIKKRVFLILGSCIMVLGIVIGGIFWMENQKSCASTNENLVSEFIITDDTPNYSSEADKRAAADNFLADVLSLEVEKLAGISDCVIDITRLNGELLGADVSITVNNSFDNALEANIQANLAQALDISAENVKISYK